MATSLEELDRRLGGGPWLVVTFVAIVVTMLACLGGLIWTSFSAPSIDRLDQARSGAVGAGKTSAKALLSYDYRTLDKDFAAGKKAATGKFRSQYAKTTSKDVEPNAKKHKVVVTAEVASTSVVTASPDRVELLLYVNQNTVSDLVKNGRVDQNRVLMTMIPVDGTWRVSQLKSL